MGVTEWWNGWKTWAQAKTSVSSEVFFFSFATAAKFGVSGRGGGVGGMLYGDFVNVGKCSPFQPHPRNEKQNSDHSGGY